MLHFFMLIIVVVFAFFSINVGGVKAIIPTPIPTLAVAPTATPIISPEVTATLALDEFGFSEERRSELNQQIQDFLNQQGEYSQDKIQNDLLPDFDKVYNLGLIYESVYLYGMQTWLFDYLEKDGDILLLAGFLGIDGQRFVTVLNIPTSLAEICPQYTPICLVRSNGWNFGSGGEVVGYSYDKVEITNCLDKNQPIIIDFVMDDISDNEARKWGGDAMVKANNHYRNNKAYRSALISQIDHNGVKISNTLDAEGKTIPKINSLSDVDDLDNYTLPFIYSLTF